MMMKWLNDHEDNRVFSSVWYDQTWATLYSFSLNTAKRENNFAWLCDSVSRPTHFHTNLLLEEEIFVTSGAVSLSNRYRSVYAKRKSISLLIKGSRKSACQSSAFISTAGVASQQAWCPQTWFSDKLFDDVIMRNTHAHTLAPLALLAKTLDEC